MHSAAASILLGAFCVGCWESVGPRQPSVLDMSKDATRLRFVTGAGASWFSDDSFRIDLHCRS